jgi:hypothetical protein
MSDVLKQLVERDLRGTKPLLDLGWNRKRVVVDQIAVPALQPLGHLLADPSEPYDTDGLVRQLVHLVGPIV